MLDKHLFNSMNDDAVFINTGRGATVIEEDLISVLAERPTLTALLDVTSPEPSEPTSPFYSMENVILTSHIAGSMNDELVRMADYIIHEFLRWERGEPLQHQVTLDMLATMG
jgi:phosphoglycerate dehydrogenase-like enzyme